MNEQLWQENADTAKGREEHRRAHTARIERRGDSVSLFEYSVFSESLGIYGKCDCIEAVRDVGGCRIPSVDFPVRLYPVEYKHGRIRDEWEYELQLCAQAMCLEEMYQTAISEGAIFYITSHRRYPITFTPELRAQVRSTVRTLEKMRESMNVPSAEYGAKCGRCSLRELCMPQVRASAKGYCEKLALEAMGGDSF